MVEAIRHLTRTDIEAFRQEVGEEERKHHRKESEFISYLKARARQESDPQNIALKLTGVSFRYPDSKDPTVSDITFTLPKAEILAILGESGSGKSTVLRLIAGFLNPREGQIIIGSQIVAGANTLPPEKRHVGIVFQDYALFPHMTVAKNVAYGVQILKNLSRSEKSDQVTQTLQMVGLADLASRYPHELSGGQQQRVAIARALAPKPQLLLLDEPFSNIDEFRRHFVRQEIAKIIRDTGVSAVLVTHDLHDVAEIADRAVEIKDGHLI